MAATERDTTDAADGSPQRHAAREAQLLELSRTLGHEFRDLDLLERALCHSSTGNLGLENYERLEFLGDAILGFLVADELFGSTPEIPEGELTDRRAAIVARRPLARVGNQLRLSDHLVGGRGLREQDRRSPRILADLVEAVCAAIYLDGGIEAARTFVRDHVMVPPDDKLRVPSTTKRDPKSRLLHYAQVNEMGQPSYELLECWGPDHERQFQVAVVLRDEQIATGSGRTKQAAEKQAAARALVALRPRSQP